MDRKQCVYILMVCLLGLFGVAGPVGDAQAAPTIPAEKAEYDAYPPFMANTPPPLVMLVMGRNHKLYYEAYNDASDLNQDGVLDITYKPDEIDYYGYFDSHKSYRYDSGTERFEPVAEISDKKVARGSGLWSGDFLNYVTMSRMDTMRKVLYGGYRVVDTATETVLERAYIPQDAHSWGKEYESEARDGYHISDYAPYDLPDTLPMQTRHFFANTSLTDPTDVSNYEPLLRILPNNPHRIWEWVAKEGPVVDGSLQYSGSNSWVVVPGSTDTGISDVTQLFFTTVGTAYESSYPGDHTAYNSMVNTIAGDPESPNPAYFQGQLPATTIDGNTNPFDPNPDPNHFMTIFL